jgi:hypothetical protein
VCPQEATAVKWQLSGTVLIACNCDYGCPCNFNALPTQGHCEGGWMWHVDRGAVDDVALDGLNFSVMVQWPGAIHEGNGHALILIDERADEAQRGAIATLVGGDHGGPWGVLAWTWPTIDGPHPVAFELELDGLNTRLRAGDALSLEMEPIRNPVSGAEVHPGAVLPEGIILKRPDFASSKTFRITNGINLEHSGRYTAIGPFEYEGL